MSDNKLVKTVFSVATLTGLTAGIGWGAKKTVKENFTAGHSSNAKNYVKLTVVLVVAIGLKQYLEDKKFSQTTSRFIYSVASVIMAGGAILNAVSVIGGNYLTVTFLAMTQRLPCKKKRIRQSFRSLPSLLFQIPKKSNEAA